MINDKHLQEEQEKFKRKLNIADLSERFSYSYFPQKSDARRTAMKGADEQDVILVQKDARTDYYLYINPYNTEDRGNVIQFVISRTGKGPEYAQKFLREYSIGASQVKSKYPVKPGGIRRNDTAAAYFNVKPLTDRKYLHSRGITDETINSFAFRGRIGNSEYQDSSTGKSYTNTVFPIINADGIIGLEQKSGNKNSTDDSVIGSEGVWVSNFPDAGRANEFFITESPVDALAHHQLSKKVKNDLSTVYISTNGILTKGHCETVQHFIDEHKPYRLTLGTDNDESGYRFNCTLLGQLSDARTTESFEGISYPFDKHTEVKASVRLIDRYTCSMRVRLSYFGKEKGVLMNDNLRQYVADINRDTERYNGKPAFKHELKYIGNSMSEAQIKFHNSKELLERTENMIKAIRPIPFFQIERPLNKNFSQDLEIALKRKKSHVLKIPPQ